ncbi:MAG: amidohydrolase family protein [Syntrophales bacterium]
MNRRSFLKTAVISTATAAMGGVGVKEATAAASKTDSRADKIDFYCHFSAMRVIDYLEAAGGPKPHVFRSLFANTPTLIDPEQRLRLMDDFGISRSVLVPLPWLETAPAVHADPQKCRQAARLLNDELAQVAARRKDRFSAVAVLPTTTPEIMIAELTRAVKDLQMVGGMYVTGPTVKRPDHPDYELLYAEASRLDVPLWMHPSRPPLYPDYLDEKDSKFQIWQALSWLQDSSAAMVRIVFAGVFERHPKLKLIIHHHGALVPLFAQRMQYGWDYFEQNTGIKQPTVISRPYIEHFKKFYCDTATQGNEPKLLEMTRAFFGTDRVLFGSDAPMDASAGRSFTGDAIASVEGMDISEKDKTRIFRGNALRLLKLG